MLENIIGRWEKRWHPLREEWVVYAAHRNSRPWTTGTVDKKIKSSPAYDPGCYLCPGNKRVHGAVNPVYNSVFIFDNDHPVVGAHAPVITADNQVSADGLYIRAKAGGIARVVCYDPRHNVTLADVDVAQVAAVFYAWRDQMLDFERHDEIKSVLIFENKGEEVGVSNPHPHCQIYAVDFVFKFTEQQIKVGVEYKAKTGKNIFEQIIANEQRDQLRIVAENENAIAFIPFFARYAYEVMVFPKKRHATLATMTQTELHDLAALFQDVTQRYDANFNMSFPYVMTIQQAPVDGQLYPEHHLYLLLLPPLRQPDLLKYLGGPEVGAGNFMADTMPEEKAAELRNAVIKNKKF